MAGPGSSACEGEPHLVGSARRLVARMAGEGHGSVLEALRRACEGPGCVQGGPEALGDAHEARVSRARGGVRKSRGVYYTPPELVERVLDMALDPVVKERVRGRRGSGAADSVLSLRVCDPACGSGRFLLAATRRLARAVGAARGRAVDAGVVREVISRCIHGMDIDADAIEVCRAALWMEWALAPGSAGDSGEFDAAVVHGDSLRGGTSYDVIVGNPPWVSFTGRQRVRVGSAARRRLVESCPSVSRWPSLHGAMLVRASEMVHKGGRIGFVLPLSVAGLGSYAGVRAAARARVRLLQPVIDVGERAFGGVVQPAGLYALGADAGAGECGQQGAWEIERDKADDGALTEVGALLDGLPRFGAGVFGDPGVHTGNVAGRIIMDSRQAGLGCARVREGRDVAAFVCGAARRWLWVSPRLGDGEYCTVRGLERYTGVPILVRQTADRPIACRHLERTYFRNSVLACHGVEGVPDVVVVAYLNSALFAWRHRALALDARQRAFPQVKVRHLAALPAIPRETATLRVGRERMVGVIERLSHEVEREPGSMKVRLEIERLVLRSFGLPPELAVRLFDTVEGGRHGGVS